MDDLQLFAFAPELENVKLPSPELLDYYKRLDDRIIFINEDITDSVHDYAMKIIEWNLEDRTSGITRPIKIFISSDGGILSSVLFLIDIIKMSKTPVYTIGMARCYSSGGLLLMSGHKRFVFPHTTYLVHDGQYGAVGSVGKVLDSFEFTKKQEELVKKYVLENSKISVEEYDTNYRKDWFMFSDEIIEKGIADVIVTDLLQIA